MRYKAVIFDLDGTLINSLEDIADCVNDVLRSYGYPTHKTERYKMMVGNGARMLIQRAFPAAAAALVDEAQETYKALYRKRSLVKTRLYPGIESLLGQLRAQGVLMAICTNKPDEDARQMVKALLPEGIFFRVVGERAGVPPKPAPDTVLELAAGMKVKPEEVVYIGDSMVDMQTGVHAGMLPAGVLWGFRGREELTASGARLLLARPEELMENISFSKKL